MIRRTVVSPAGTLYTVTAVIDQWGIDGTPWAANVVVGWSGGDVEAGSASGPITTHATEADAIAWATAEVDRRCGSYPDA